MEFLRIRSKRKEIMVAPDKEFLMMVIQNPSVAESFTLEWMSEWIACEDRYGLAEIVSLYSK